MINIIMYNKQELIRMVQRVIDCEDDEDTIDQLLEILDDNLPHPSIWDLIYWPPNEEELSAEEIIDIALSYQWKKNQKKCYSPSMKELIATCEFNKNTSIVMKDILPKDFVVSVKPVTLIHGKTDVHKEVENNTLNLYNLSNSNDFEKQLQVVESLENWLKDSFPNKMFCSYFLYSETTASKFCFHMECPNMDWLSDKKVKSSNDCIRKNTF